MDEKWKIKNAINILLNLLYTSDRLGSDEVAEIKNTIELLANSEEISRELMEIWTIKESKNGW